MKKLLILILVLLSSCHEIIIEDDKEKVDLIKEGFAAFKKGDYTTAESKFEEAQKLGTDVLLDIAYMGAGYSEMRQLKHTEALASFEKALLLNPDQTDAKVGNMFIQYAVIKNYQRTIELGNDIKSKRLVYIFEHDKSINRDDVLLHIALAKYQLKNYVDSYQEARALTSQTLNTNSPSFTSDLANLLNNLVQQLQ